MTPPRWRQAGGCPPVVGGTVVAPLVGLAVASLVDTGDSRPCTAGGATAGRRSGSVTRTRPLPSAVLKPTKERVPVRVTAAFSRLLRLPGVWVRDVDFDVDQVMVTVALRRRRLRCPECPFSTSGRYDTRPVGSTWRHLDLGVWRLQVRTELRRLLCPAHGVRREHVPFARPGSHFTRDFEDLVGWLATVMDKTAVRRLVRIDWDSVGRIIERVMADGLDADRLEGLFDIGVDEVSCKEAAPVSHPGL